MQVRWQINLLKLGQRNLRNGIIRQIAVQEHAKSLAKAQISNWGGKKGWGVGGVPKRALGTS